MKEIGIYNVLKTSKSMPMSVAKLLQESNDEHLETNLNSYNVSIVVQNGGTK